MRREIEFPGDLNSRSFDLRKIAEIEIFAVEIEFKDMRSEIVHSAACNVSAPAGKLKLPERDLVAIDSYYCTCGVERLPAN